MFRDVVGSCSLAINQYYTLSPTILMLKGELGWWNVHFGVIGAGEGLKAFRGRGGQHLFGSFRLFQLITCIHTRGTVGHSMNTAC